MSKWRMTINESEWWDDVQLLPELEEAWHTCSKYAPVVKLVKIAIGPENKYHWAAGSLQ